MWFDKWRLAALYIVTPPHWYNTCPWSIHLAQYEWKCWPIQAVEMFILWKYWSCENVGLWKLWKCWPIQAVEMLAHPSCGNVGLSKLWKCWLIQTGNVGPSKLWKCLNVCSCKLWKCWHIQTVEMLALPNCGNVGPSKLKMFAHPITQNVHKVGISKRWPLIN